MDDNVIEFADRMGIWEPRMAHGVYFLVNTLPRVQEDGERVSEAEEFQMMLEMGAPIDHFDRSFPRDPRSAE